MAVIFLGAYSVPSPSSPREEERLAKLEERYRHELLDAEERLGLPRPGAPRWA